MKQRNILKGKPLNFNVGIQKWYVKELLKLVDDLTQEVYKEIKPLYKEYKEQITFTEDASISSQTRIKLNSLRDMFEKKFKDRGKTYAERMVRKTNRNANKTFWSMMNDMLKSQDEVKKAGGFLMKGSLITPEKEEVIKALVYENTSLITNIQTHYFEQKKFLLQINSLKFTFQTVLLNLYVSYVTFVKLSSLKFTYEEYQVQSDVKLISPYTICAIYYCSRLI